MAPVSSGISILRKIGSDPQVGFLREHWEEYTNFNQI